MSSQQPTTTASLTVPTSTAHPGIERASAHLAAVLVGNGDVDAVLSSSEVILRLADVSPPLPPHRLQLVRATPSSHVTAVPAPG